MEQLNLKLLIENELYPLVLANSEDELAKIIYLLFFHKSNIISEKITYIVITY